MPRSDLSWTELVSIVRATFLYAILPWAISSPPLVHASKNTQLPTVRWSAGCSGCTFERGDDGRYRWRMIGNDLDVILIVDSQELAKSRHRFYHLFAAYVSVTYTGKDRFEFPADVRIDFVRHHDVREGYEDPALLSSKLQNDVDTKVFETERQIKKNPKIADEKTAVLRQYQKEAAEFIEFVSTQTLSPDKIVLTQGNPEDHGWVLFATSNRWIGPWKEREDFVLSLWMKDRIWQFPFSLPPTEGDLILRKPPN